MSLDTFDLLVLGAGTHGTGVAADAAGRGLRACVLDELDIGESTARVSSRLLVGGLRYLEQWHLSLVRQSLAERRVLLERAGFLIDVRPFIQVVHPNRMKLSRARMLMRAYDWLGARSLGRHQLIDLASHEYGTPLRHQFERGLMYYDCTGYDVRLAALNARLGSRHGACIAPRTRVLRIRRVDRTWELECKFEGESGNRRIRANALVNTAGPWAEALLEQSGIRSRCRARQVKISHLVVPALYEGNQVYVLTGSTGHRICVNPIGDGLHLVGAAENDFGGHSDPDAPTAGEIAWLCALVNEHFRQPLHEKDIVHAYSGLRPVYDDPANPGERIARHFLLDLDCPDCHSPLLRVYGGRVTNYRCMSESALEILKPWLPDHGGRWTAGAKLPGGGLDRDAWHAEKDRLRQRYAAIATPTLERLMDCYGDETDAVLSTRAGVAEPLVEVAPGILAGELVHLAQQEWVGESAQALRRIGMEHVTGHASDAAINGFLAANTVE